MNYPVSMKIEGIYSVFLVSPLVGIGYSLNLSSKFLFFGTISVGYGITEPIANIKFFMQPPGEQPQRDEKKIEGSGGSLVGRVGVSAKYSITDKISLFGGASYRVANIPEVRAKKDVDMDNDGVIGEGDIKAGEPLKDQDGKVISFDYSGLSLNIGISFKF